MSTKKVRFIDLDAMGLGMALCLVKAGFPVTGFDFNQKAITVYYANTPRDSGPKPWHKYIIIC